MYKYSHGDASTSLPRYLSSEASLPWRGTQLLTTLSRPYLHTSASWVDDQGLYRRQHQQLIWFSRACAVWPWILSRRCVNRKTRPPITKMETGGGLSASECPVCWLELGENRIPYSLTCGHTLCKLCVKKLFGSNKSMVCPLCRETIQMEGIKVSYISLKLNYG